LDELLAWANNEQEVRSSYRPLSLEEVSALAQGSLIEVGAHTVSHSDLSTLPAAAQQEEIQSSKAQLEELLNRPVTSFSYPYGSLSGKTATIVREAGFVRACSVNAELVKRPTDPFRLPRLQVQDWGGDEFARQLSAWFDSRSV